MTGRYYYDTEFLEDGRTIELISIGIVADDGREYYAVNSEVNDSNGYDSIGERIARSPWLMENVVPQLPLATKVAKYTSSGHYMPLNLDMRDTRVKPRWVIANEVRDFLLVIDGMHLIEDIGMDEIELWAWYGAYDHVALMQLWGPMIRRPRGLPSYTRDLRQELDRQGGDFGGPELPQQEAGVHDALADARHNMVRAKVLGLL